MTLTPLQKKLCNILQDGLPIVPRPFADIAEQIGLDEAAVIAETKKLIKEAVIRRISASVNYKAIGRVGALAAAHIEPAKLDMVVAAVNKLQGVSHNYLREHFYNLWFTLQGESEKEVESILFELGGKAGAVFYALYAVRTFKLDVRFDAESDGLSLLPFDEKKITTENTGIAAIKLTKEERALVAKLQRGLEITAEPFGGEETPIIKNLMIRGVIRRIAAVVNYHKLGFEANAMFVCEVEPAGIEEAGKKLSMLKNVSHCYQRSVFKGWPYNLFGMMHGKNMGQIEKMAQDFAYKNKISHFSLLKTLKELKKEPAIVM